MKLALLSLFLPFLTALLLLLFRAPAGRGADRAPMWVASTVLLISLLSLLAAAGALRQAVEEGPALLAIGGWDSPLAIRLLADPLASVLLAFTALVHLLVGLYAAVSRRGVPADYWPLSCFLHTALAALWLSADLFNLYVTLEMLSLAAVALVALAGPRAWRAALNYLLLSLMASLCYLPGVALLYAEYGTLDVIQLGGLTRATFPTTLALILMTLGLMLKAALFPLHLWLPSAHANAPTAVSALLSALVVKGPIFILWTVWTQLAPEEVAQRLGPLLAGLGILALVMGGLAAWRAPFLKTLVAYSTVAQLGYAMLALGLLLFWRRPELHIALWLFVLAHGLAKVSLFLAAGELQATLKSKRVARLKGATQTVPVAMFAFAVAGGSLIGLPPSGGFLAKWVLLGPLFSEPERWPWAFGILLGTMISAGYVFRAVALGFDRAPGNGPPVTPDRPAQWLALLPALLVWGMGLNGEQLIYWLTGIGE